MEKRTGRRDENQNGTKWPLQTSKLSWSEFGLKCHEQQIVLKVYNFCIYIDGNISFLFQYRRYMKNHGPDRMTFDDS